MSVKIETASRTLFMMRNCARQILIDEHLFYFEQAKRRLLSQFDNIEQEADDVIENHSLDFNPDFDDPHSADETGYEYFKLLCEMRRQTQLSVVAGMFHHWEKQLRQWLNNEIHFWHKGEHVKEKIWSAAFAKIAELLEIQGWSVRNATYFKVLDDCRLVVNVHKHGDGRSLSELKQKCGEYLVNPFKKYNGELANLLGNNWEGDHSHLLVSDIQIKAFSDAIVAFWQDVPEKILRVNGASFPKWFDAALKKDLPGKMD